MVYRGRWLPLRPGTLPGREEWHGRPPIPHKDAQRLLELCFGRAVAIRGDRRPAHIQPDIFDLVGGDACSCQLRRVEASRNVEQPATAEIEAGGEEERGSPAAERDSVDNQVARVHPRGGFQSKAGNGHFRARHHERIEIIVGVAVREGEHIEPSAQGEGPVDRRGCR